MHASSWSQIYLSRIYIIVHSDTEYVYASKNIMNYKCFQSRNEVEVITVKYNKSNYQIVSRLCLKKKKKKTSKQTKKKPESWGYCLIYFHLLTCQGSMMAFWRCSSWIRVNIKQTECGIIYLYISLAKW